MKQDVGDHKPMADRLNKVGLALTQLVSPAATKVVQGILDDDNKRIEAMRLKVRERSNSIDLAMQQSAEVSGFCFMSRKATNFILPITFL